MGRKPTHQLARIGVAAALLGAATLAPGAAARADFCNRDLGVQTDPGELAVGVPSSDARYVAFGSQANALLGVVRDPWNRVFQMDRSTGRIYRVSPRATSDGNTPLHHADEPSISGDGTKVAFTVGPTSTRMYSDVYVRDDVTGATMLVSRASGADGAPADGPSFDPALSSDGTKVAFTSAARNLDLADVNPGNDVYIRDLVNGTTTLVSRANGPAGPGGNAASSDATVDRGGTRIAFTSDATNLDAGPEDPGAHSDVFVRDLSAGTTVLVSRGTGPAGVGGDGQSFGPSIDAAGAHVSFSSSADVAFGQRSTHLFDVFVRDLEAETTTLVSRGEGLAGVLANGYSFASSIDAAGNRVAFESSASNLDPSVPESAQPRRANRVYVRDLARGHTTLVSPLGDRAGGRVSSQFPTMSGDGRVVVFSSIGTEKGLGGTPRVWNIYARDLQTGKTSFVAATADPLPDSSISRVPRASGSRLSFTGRAAGARAVEVALVRLARGQQIWLTRAGRTRVVRTGSGPCRTEFWLRVRGTSHWQLRLGRALPPGRYVIYSRAISADGQPEDSFDTADRNKRSFRLR
ncbi:MAG TPA: hypothetical protein VE570_11945 [Thermoleophilaceae bacterium]|nr:hypothetical protein [Thermoleophilaceae bacterium]